MAVKRVFGKVDGTEVIYDFKGRNRWQVPVPLDVDGEYIVEIIAEDEAGNQSCVAKLLYTVDAGSIRITSIPSLYRLERQDSSFIFECIYPMYRR